MRVVLGMGFAFIPGMTLAITIPGGSAPALSGTPLTREPTLFGGDGLGFYDLLDAINPLKQLPIISTIYEELTGDAGISAASRIAGGALFGGPIGAITGAANAALEAATGKDAGKQFLALFNSDDSDAPSTMAMILANEQGGAPSPMNRSAYEAYQFRMMMA